MVGRQEARFPIGIFEWRPASSKAGDASLVVEHHLRGDAAHGEHEVGLDDPELCSQEMLAAAQLIVASDATVERLAFDQWGDVDLIAS